MPLYDITDKKAVRKALRRDVYRNLHFRDEVVYSVRKDRLVEGYALCYVMDGVTFHVSANGNQRVRDEQRKNVHALIRGHVINAVWHYADMYHDAFELGWAKDAAKSMADMETLGVPASLNTNYDQDDPRAWEPMYKWVEVVYNPYKYRTFMTRDTDPFRSTKDVYEPIFEARKVVMHSENNKSKVMAMIPCLTKN